jgi:hypothetical protein
MQIRNVSPLGALDVTLLRRVVDAGEVVEVTAEQGKQLIDQGIFEAVAAKTKKED